MKPISPRLHGALDYLTAGTFIALPRLLGWSSRATRVLTGAGAVVIAMSLLTRYELALVKVLPMKGHLALDGLLNAALFAAQFQLTEEDSSVRGAVAGMALAGTAIMLLTRSE